MQVHLEFYASLMRLLPPGSQRHRASFELEEGVTVQALLEKGSVPEKEAHLVVLNGVYVAPEQRVGKTLSEGDVLAVWPPVAGG